MFVSSELSLSGEFLWCMGICLVSGFRVFGLGCSFTHDLSPEAQVDFRGLAPPLVSKAGLIELRQFSESFSHGSGIGDFAETDGLRTDPGQEVYFAVFVVDLRGEFGQKRVCIYLMDKVKEIIQQFPLLAVLFFIQMAKIIGWEGEWQSSADHRHRGQVIGLRGEEDEGTVEIEIVSRFADHPHLRRSLCEANVEFSIDRGIDIGLLDVGLIFNQAFDGIEIDLAQGGTDGPDGAVGKPVANMVGCDESLSSAVSDGDLESRAAHLRFSVGAVADSHDEVGYQCDQQQDVEDISAARRHVMHDRSNHRAGGQSLCPKAGAPPPPSSETIFLR